MIFFRNEFSVTSCSSLALYPLSCPSVDFGAFNCVKFDLERNADKQDKYTIDPG